MNITEIIPTEISGYCDVETGECITAETGTPHGTPTENAAHTDDQISTMLDDHENLEPIRCLSASKDAPLRSSTQRISSRDPLAALRS
jgi:hypothetical protein